MKKTVLVLITFALVIAVAGSGFWLVHYFIDSREQRQTYETLAEEFVLESTPSVRPESSSSLDSSVDAGENDVSSPVESPDTPPRHDLAALAAENPDCVGWLTIPDTGIDYPVMHTPDDPEHYLRRDFYGNSASGGTPFLDGRNLAEAENQNLILYGHNMMDGSMFKPLMNYLEPNFRDTHKDIFLEIDGRQYLYQEELFSPILSLLEEIATRQGQGNTKLYELNTALADLNEKIHTLQRLHNKGFIEDGDFREQTEALASQRKKLSDQRGKTIHGSKALETLDKLRELQRQLESLPEIPWEFDIGLFDQLVEKIVPVSNTELLFKLKCGLELKEVVPQ